MDIKIKYFADITELNYIEGDKSDWIDLRCAKDTFIKKGETKLIPLGVGMILPDGYEAHIVPRSSTEKHFGVMQANSFGVVDNKFNGNDDEWLFNAYAIRDTFIAKNERICQFKVEKKQPHINFIRVDRLNDKSRGGYGSTGRI